MVLGDTDTEATDTSEGGLLAESEVEEELRDTDSHSDEDEECADREKGLAALRQAHGLNNSLYMIASLFGPLKMMPQHTFCLQTQL